MDNNNDNVVQITNTTIINGVELPPTPQPERIVEMFASIQHTTRNDSSNRNTSERSSQ